MITKINRIRKFGVFQNMDWGALPEFKKKNLIYGWNYSGKTTLSRLASIVYENREIDTGIEFKLICDAVSYTHLTLPTTPYV